VPSARKTEEVWLLRLVCSELAGMF
jgi:hypothetical protein